MYRKSIFKALVALMFIMLGANFNVEAQSGSLSIPKPDANGQVVTFNRKGNEVGKWNPATLEFTMNDGAVYKLDANTGKFTDSQGSPKGSISADARVEAPNFGTIQVEQDGTYFFYVWRNEEKLGAVLGAIGEVYYKDRRLGDNGTVSDKTISPLLMAYVYFGLVFTPDDFDKKAKEAEEKKKSMSNLPAFTPISSSSSSSSSTGQKDKKISVEKGSHDVGYVDGYGNVYDRYENKIGKLPEGNGDILDASGRKIGEIWSGEIKKDGTVVCKVERNTLYTKSRKSSSYIIMGDCDGDRVTCRNNRDEDQNSFNEIGRCYSNHPEWNAALIFCDFFF